MNLSSDRGAAQPGWGPPRAVCSHLAWGTLLLPLHRGRLRLGLVRRLPGATGGSELGLVQRGGLCTPRIPGVLQAARAVHYGVPGTASGSGGSRHCRHPQNSPEAQSQTRLPRVGGWLSHTE